VRGMFSLDFVFIERKNSKCDQAKAVFVFQFITMS